MNEIALSLDTVWMLLAAMLVFWMQPGFALCEAGFTRGKNTVNILFKNFVDFMFGSLLFWFVGFGLMFDPFEIHVTVHVKWGWNSFWQPDYYSPYYYRFGYPLDGGVNIGLYYQLSPRHGHSRAQLRKMARKIVESENR